MILLMLTAGISVSAAPACPLPFNVVPDEAAARAIAKIVIASAPKIEVSRHTERYDLRVSYVEMRGTWLVYEHAVTADPDIFVTGGGGLEMEISACDGAISEIRRQA